MIDPYGPVPLHQAAEDLGVPAIQLQRWMATGAFPPVELNEHGQVIRTFWQGNVRIPRRITLTGDGYAVLRDVVIPAASQPHQHAA